MSDARKQRRCERKGHKWTKELRRGYDSADMTGDYWHYRCTAHAVQQEREFCRRCKEATDWVTVEDHCINSLTMDSGSMDELRRDGVLWR